MDCGKVIIVASGRLNELRLNGIIGKSGLIVEDLTYKERKNKGFMIHLEEPYMEEYLWFVPIESIKYEE